MNRLKFIIPFMISFLAMVNIHAELPYETDQDHSFVVTGGKQWFESSFINSSEAFTFSYIYQNKISLGVSHRNFTTTFIYEDTGNDLSGIVHGGTAYGGSNYINLDSYSNLFVQISPMNLLQIEVPFSLSVLGAYQFYDSHENVILTAHFYKKIELSKKDSVQPTFSIGYRDISIFTSNRKGSIAGSVIYSRSIYKRTNLLIVPRVNYFLDDLNFAVQIGISHGLGK